MEIKHVARTHKINLRKYCHTKWKGCTQSGSIVCLLSKAGGKWEVTEKGKESVEKLKLVFEVSWGLNVFYISNCRDGLYDIIFEYIHVTNYRHGSIRIFIFDFGCICSDIIHNLDNIFQQKLMTNSYLRQSGRGQWCAPML